MPKQDEQVEGEEFLFEACASEESLTLYWDKPKAAHGLTFYRLELSDGQCIEVESTHAKVESLQPETKYQVELSMRSGEGEPWICIGSKAFATGIRKRRIDITQAPYLAVGDGQTLNTAAIQQALDDCGPQERVVIPQGVFMTGALRMHSCSELYVSLGAVLQGTANPSDYEPLIASRFEGIEMDCYSSLINIGYMDHTRPADTHSVVLRGGGTIASGGRQLMDKVIAVQSERLKEQMNSDDTAYDTPETVPARTRPRLINVSNAFDVEMADLTFADSASWNIHMIYSHNIVTHDCQVRSLGVWNGDGWDPDSCENCALFGTAFDTGDDMVAIKSGKNPQGNEINRPSKHIRVFDCTSTHGHGISLGSEMSGGIEDVRIWDCDITQSFYGIHIKSTAKRGGYIRNVSVRDCQLAQVAIHAVGYNDDGSSGPGEPKIEHLRFEGLRILGRFWGPADEVFPTPAILIQGFEGPEHLASDIVFSDIDLAGVPSGTGRIEMDNCTGVTLEHVSCRHAPTTNIIRM
ncbi:hypothetical protein KIM372_05040 [Bombiscardovia nodaiensis]|uniref:Fibronectin type-III domain-containing protein n=1 Tax=Bombiscardovia nodaiensis TaxID=2932181 RepID=A0ABN6SBH5_9BIFI|nr:hypothetical protein KIM372_05040 [Bombiscardovia nodaiensis]